MEALLSPGASAGWGRDCRPETSESTPGFWWSEFWRCLAVSPSGDLIMASFLDSIGYNSWVLPALLVIPLVGAVIVMMLPVRDPAELDGGVESPAARQVALWFFVVEFLVSLGLWWSFDPADTGWQASIDTSWIPTWGVRFTLGVDGI